MISADFKQYGYRSGVADEWMDSFLDLEDDGAGYAGGIGQFTGFMRGAGYCGRSGEDATRWHD